MLSREILQFSEMRYEIRAYLCFLLQRNIKNHLPHIELNKIIEGLHKIEKEVGVFELLYVLDATGTLAIDGISRNPTLECKKGDNHKHTGIYCKIMDWQTKRSKKFISLIGRKENK